MQIRPGAPRKLEGAVIILVDTKDPLKVPFTVLGLCMPVLLTLPRAHETLWDSCRAVARAEAQAAAEAAAGAAADAATAESEAHASLSRPRWAPTHQCSVGSMTLPYQTNRVCYGNISKIIAVAWSCNLPLGAKACRLHLQKHLRCRAFCQRSRVSLSVSSLCSRTNKLCR